MEARGERVLNSRVYRPDERPDVEVLVDGRWCQGELRMWTQREDGTWWADVQWRPRPGETYLDTFPADQVRLDETEPRPAPGLPPLLDQPGDQDDDADDR